MSDLFEPELEPIQDLVGQDSVDADEATGTDGFETAENQPKKQGLVASLFSMDIYNAMLLLSLVFIFLATLNMLFVLRTYNGSFPFGGGFPWSPNV